MISNRQDQLRRWYAEQIDTRWVNPEDVYARLVSAAVHEGAVVLEIGIGHSTFFKDVYARASEVIGLDPEQGELEKNPIVQRPLVGRVERIPLLDQSVDVIVMTWVVEHLTDPEAAFRECARVLRPGGRVLFITPNAIAPHVWIARLVPQRFHESLARRAYGRGEHETYPTVYRANRIGAISRLLKAASLEIVVASRIHDPTYLGFTKPLLWGSHVLSMLLAFPPFSFFRSTIVVEAISPVSREV